MNPGCFDRIARTFPDLALIGAHLALQFTASVQMMAQMHGNVYLDLSGGSGRKPHLSYLRGALAPFLGANWDDPQENLAILLFGKLLFATDNPPAPVGVAASNKIMDYRHIPARVGGLFWWKNAARMLRLHDL